MTSPTPERPKLARRVWEWFWRADALRAARQRNTENRRQSLYQQRARIAAEVGELTLDPPGPWLAGSATHLAAALFVEAIGWSLRVASAKESAGDSDDLRPATPAELGELVVTQRSLLLEAAADPDVVARVVEHLQERRFEALSLPAEANQAARELRQVARGLLRATAQRTDDLDRVLLQRALRTGLVALLPITLGLGVMLIGESLDRRNEVSVGKPWVASSTYETVCQSPNHTCPGDKPYFFHTQQEKNPWLEIDLQSAQSISRVRVINRQDCCAERAVPLRVEISADHSHWKEVARRTETFDDWTARFPASQARWVRLRVIGNSFLHLTDVRVLK